MSLSQCAVLNDFKERKKFYTQNKSVIIYGHGFIIYCGCFHSDFRERNTVCYPV